jgi:hypothetical protein
MPRIRRRNPENLPPRVYFKNGGYRYVTVAGKWVTLGKEWDLEARTRWAELAGEDPPAGTVTELLNEYVKRVVPKKAARTQVGNLQELKRIRVVFGQMRVQDLKLRHASEYLERRGAAVRANREIALFSHAVRWGMNVGLCDFERHPFDLLMYNKEQPRRRRVDVDEFWRYVNFAKTRCPAVAAVMWLMDLTVQRRVDLLELKRSAEKTEGIEIAQSKTGVRLLIEWTPELREAWQFALEVHKAELAKKNIASLYVLSTRDGQKYSDAGIKALHARTMAAALDTKWGPPVLTERFRQQDIRPKGVSDVGGGKRGKDLAGHKTQVTTDRVYDRITFKKVQPTR